MSTRREHSLCVVRRFRRLRLYGARAVVGGSNSATGLRRGTKSALQRDLQKRRRSEVHAENTAKKKSVDTIRDLVVQMILGLRREYLDGPGRTRVIDHWTDLQNALRRCVNGSQTVEEALTKMRTVLRLDAARADNSVCLIALVAEVHDEADTQMFFDLLTREHALLIAMAHVKSDEAREARLRDQGEVR